MHATLNSVSQHTLKKPGAALFACNYSDGVGQGRQRQEANEELLGIILAKPQQDLGSMRDHTPKEKNQSDRICDVFLRLPCVYTGRYTCTHFLPCSAYINYTGMHTQACTLVHTSAHIVHTYRNYTGTHTWTQSVHIVHT